MDPNWFLSAEIQSVAAMVAIVSGYLINAGITSKNLINSFLKEIKNHQEDVDHDTEKIKQQRYVIFESIVYLEFNYKEAIEVARSGRVITFRDQTTFDQETYNKLEFTDLEIKFTKFVLAISDAKKENYEELIAHWKTVLTGLSVDVVIDQMSKLSEYMDTINFKTTSGNIKTKAINRSFKKTLDRSVLNKSLVFSIHEDVSAYLDLYERIRINKSELDSLKIKLAIEKASNSINFGVYLIGGIIILGIIVPSISLLCLYNNIFMINIVNITNLIIFTIILISFWFYLRETLLIKTVV